MNRRFRMVARVMLPGVGLLLLAILAQAMVGRLGSSPFLAGIYSAAGWISLAAFVLGVATLGQASYRVWRWSNGHGPECSACAGMLGRKQLGRHGPYRRCLTCAKSNARRRHAYARTDERAH